MCSGGNQNSILWKALQTLTTWTLVGEHSGKKPISPPMTLFSERVLFSRARSLVDQFCLVSTFCSVSHSSRFSLFEGLKFAT